jgi:predicted dithiol-disulfide oxidoreductase (DUF899 family)
MSSNVENPRIVSKDEWLAARKQLLAEEKNLTRHRDEVNRLRRALPWTKIEKQYVFDSPNGKVTLSDLFEGRSQLIVSHFMFGPGWAEGCVGCSFRSDHVAGALVHLENHDVSYVTVSRAPLPEIMVFQQRMGWPFKWLSSFASDFNFDFRVSFTPEEIASGSVDYNYSDYREFLSEEMSGVSVFYKDEAGQIFHTYSTFARGDEMVDTAYMYLDLTPKGRDETGPHFNLMDWVRHHDKYENGAGAKQAGSCCHAQDAPRNAAAAPAPGN